MAITLVQIGQRIRSHRREQGMSQQRLALLTKLSQPAIARIERGLVNPRWVSLERISAALGKDICSLLCGRTVQGSPVSELARRAAGILESKDTVAISVMLNGITAAETILSRPPARLPKQRRSAVRKTRSARTPAALDPRYTLPPDWYDPE